LLFAGPRRSPSIPRQGAGAGRPAGIGEKTIQNNVLRLRKLGRTVIETVGDGYRLADHVELDIDWLGDAPPRHRR
jgi:hypothetical protein